MNRVRLPGGDRLPSLTGLRFIAAFTVFGFHVRVQGFLGDGPADRVFDRLFAGGSAGVGFFFILSGFVLTWSARPGDTARAIWRRRAARIVPNHVVAWFIALAGMIVAGKALSVWASAPSLFLVQAWFPTQRVYFAVNTPAWSLSCELAFYLAFPFLLPLVRRIPVPRLWAAAGLLVAAVFLVPVVALALPGDVAYWFVWVFPVTRALDFVLGMVVARIVQAGRWVRTGLWLPSGLVLAGYAAAPYLPARFGFVAVTVIPFALLIGATASADLAHARTPWRSAPVVLLGEVSFAFYLLHQLVIRGIDQGIGHRTWPTAQGFALTGAMLVVGLAAAWVLHKAVERPMVRLLATRPKRRAKAVCVPGGEAVELGQA